LRPSSTPPAGRGLKVVALGVPPDRLAVPTSLMGVPRVLRVDWAPRPMHPVRRECRP
jgi:hypothetical protein